MRTKKKTRVVFTIPNFNTAGSGKAMLNIALGLDPTIFEAHIACQSDAGSFFKVVKESGLPTHVFDYIPRSRPISNLLKETWRVAQKWKEINPDIIHSFHYSDNYTEGLAARLAGVKWVFTKKNMSWAGKSGNGWKLRSALANGIAVQNTDMIKQFYPTSTKTMLIPRGVVVENFAQQAPDPELKEQMGSARGQRIIICVANMVPVKGVELLIQAFHQLADTYQNWDVWLVGDIKNDYGKKLIQVVTELKRENRIHFSGKQPNVRNYLDHAELFVLPTKDEGRREGSPVALLEAMANGKVVIGSAVPGVKDQLKHFPEHQFEPGNWHDLKDKLEGFLKNEVEENTNQGKQFMAHAKENYSIKLEISRHEMFYEKLFQ